jgi:redox-sensitive bicupin YhaK (pirin superfamily)
MSSSSKTVIRAITALGQGPMPTIEPFLFAVYHRDLYPAGNALNMEAPRRGDGADFDWSQPYRMYHGDRIPGFPQHPHRGFETLTIVRKGTCDHTDSLGNGGRFGGDGLNSDLCWMTAGSGIVHGENFPLRHANADNTLLLWQIWLNLPGAKKMAPPNFKMYWAEKAVHVKGENGASVEVVAGRYGGVAASGGAAPPIDSWGADPKNDIAVFLVTLPPGGRVAMPPAAGAAAINRMAYVVEGPRTGAGVSVAGAKLPASARGRAAVELAGDAEIVLENDANSTEEAWILVLQGRPIGEPVAQHGPFVMNTQAEIQKAFADYRSTQFGGWPWDSDAVVFERSRGRFAEMRSAKGGKTIDLPPSKTDL